MSEKNEKKSVSISLENHAKLETLAKAERRTISATLDLLLERSFGGSTVGNVKPFNTGKLSITPVEDYPSEAGEREAINEKD